jgi:hypothetical protein
MSSNNYAVYGNKFSLEGTFRVLRMTDSRSEPPLDYEEVECATKANSSELRALITTAQSLQFVDFGNGLRGLYAECDGFQFCVVPELEESKTTEHQRPTQLEDSDDEEPF